MSAADQVDPEFAYFRDLERAFVQRRGDPLFISNADWVFLSRLRKKSIPLRVVLRGMTDAFDAHAHSFARKQKIRSLRFCENEIAAAALRHRRALHSEGGSRRGLQGALSRLDQQLAGASSPALEAVVSKARQRVRDILTSAKADIEFDIDAALAAAEDTLADDAAALAGRDEAAAVERSAREATRLYRDRLPARVYETLITESVRRRTLQRLGLPRFHLADLE